VETVADTPGAMLIFFNRLDGLGFTRFLLEFGDLHIGQAMLAVRRT
jgi:hypothetical protein